MVILAGCYHTGPKPFQWSSEATAARLIWSHPYPDLLIEVDYVEGLQPFASTIEHLNATLHNLTDKREISLIVKQLPDEPRFEGWRNWSIDELLLLTRETFDSGTLEKGGAGSQAFLHVLFLNGQMSTGDSHSPVGFMKYETLFIFPQTMHSAVRPVVLVERQLTYEVRERNVVTHELGHALGLVNGEVPMIHARQAPDRTRHSAYPSSPMYYQSRADLAPLEPATGEDYAPDQFDEYDLQDLAAFREQGRRVCVAYPQRCE